MRLYRDRRFCRAPGTLRRVLIILEDLVRDRLSVAGLACERKLGQTGFVDHDWLALFVGQYNLKSQRLTINADFGLWYYQPQFEPAPRIRWFWLGLRHHRYNNHSEYNTSA